MYNQKANLVQLVTTLNTYGDPMVTASTSTTVFCKVVSADEKEKSFAESRGQSAELVIILPDKKMYHDELRVTYCSTDYKIQDRKFSDGSPELKLVVGKWETH